MEFKMIIAMLLLVTTTSLAHPFQSYITNNNNQATCDESQNGLSFCTEDCTKIVKCVDGELQLVVDCSPSLSRPYCFEFNNGQEPACSYVNQCEVTTKPMTEVATPT